MQMYNYPKPSYNHNLENNCEYFLFLLFATKVGTYLVLCKKVVTKLTCIPSSHYY